MHLVMLPPVVTDADRALVARQLGREPRTLRRVAVRCPFGAPAVTEQSPYGADGEPFPTTYYLTCRHLVAAVSRLEAAGGVERWSEATRTDAVLSASLAAGDEEQRRKRRELAGDATGSGFGDALLPHLYADDGVGLLPLLAEALLGLAVIAATWARLGVHPRPAGAVEPGMARTAGDPVG